jgi:ABC-2 type transport system ATP-binding protein
VITVDALTKRFGAKVAVDSLSFVVRPGVVTGFLGPNGSGKSTTMRCMLGLDRPNGGQTLFDGREYTSIRNPLFEVGALLDAGYAHPGRTARNHLRWLAASNGIVDSRADEVLAQVGLEGVAKERVRGFSLGMRQRLGLAAVLLGDPHTVILDEPANGLDPEGMRWIRDVLTFLARQGKTVLVSSHLLSEMAQMADELVVIGRGRLIEQCPVSDFVDRYADRWVKVISPSAAALVAALRSDGATVSDGADPTTFEVRGMAAVLIGEAAARVGAVLHELSPQAGSLEEAYMAATAADVEYGAAPLQQNTGGG